MSWSIHTILTWAVPLCYLAAALPATWLRTVDTAWRIAVGAALAGLALTLASVAAAVAGAAPLDLPGLAMALLSAALGAVIVRYSRRYLQGEAGQRRYIAALLAALAAIAIIVRVHDFGWLVLAWIAGSFALTPLLTFYPKRVAAVFAAHKKRVASRIAEACLALALVLLARGAGGLDFDTLAQAADLARAHGGLPWTLELATVLIAVAVLIKSAQMPLHGWLMQVMEAPTPVSALLHAGVVNLGGFVLIRLAPLIAASPWAQALLVLVGSASATLAALVMMTRVSIKVRLAWSTCAQIGFMLLECGLGLHALALLHLLAHSLYKSYAFLSAGETVLAARKQAMVPAEARPGMFARLAAAAAAIGLLAAMAHLARLSAGLDMPAPVAILIAGLGLAPLLWAATAGGLAAGLLRVVAAGGLYLGWHALVGGLIGSADADVPVALAAWTAVCFATLYIVQSWLLTWPQGRLAARLHPAAFAGFAIDDRVTPWLLRVWPVTLPRSDAVTHDAPRTTLQGDLA